MTRMGHVHLEFSYVFNDTLCNLYIKNTGMGVACSTYWGEMYRIFFLGGGGLRETENLEYLDVDGIIFIKMYFQNPS